MATSHQRREKVSLVCGLCETYQGCYWEEIELGQTARVWLAQTRELTLTPLDVNPQGTPAQVTNTV